MLPEPGTPAPDFTAPDQHGQPFTLGSLRGSRVALYFYPKDDTPGCTAQACNLRDNEAQLAAQGVRVVGGRFRLLRYEYKNNTLFTVPGDTLGPPLRGPAELQLADEAGNRRVVPLSL